jgi:hypothetical protein
VRVLAAALETGRPGASSGRAELAGLRGGLQGEPGTRVIVEHTRIAAAALMEAEAARREGVPIERLALPALHAAVDHAQAAVARGFEQAQAMRAAPPQGPPAAR